jgi:hypothetical protein
MMFCRFAAAPAAGICARVVNEVASGGPNIGARR